MRVVDIGTKQADIPVFQPEKARDLLRQSKPAAQVADSSGPAPAVRRMLAKRQKSAICFMCILSIADGLADRWCRKRG